MGTTYYYNSFQDDIIKTQNQDYNLKNGYKWTHKSIIYKTFSYLLYYIVLFAAFIYSRFFLHIKIKNKTLLKHQKGYFLYSNHTQILGDVLNPFIICFKRRPFIICSTANLGIPIIGKILPMAGAVPIPKKIHKMPLFKDAIRYRSDHGHPIVIYPEAHLWPYATFIREFAKTSFRFPAESGAKVFSATTVYNKSRFFKKPKITIFIDGPFSPDKAKTVRENAKILHSKVYETMVKRASLSDYEYVKYEKKISEN